MSAQATARIELAQQEAALEAAQMAAAAEPNREDLQAAVRQARWKRDLIANQLALPAEPQSAKGGLLSIRGINTVAALQIVDAQGNVIGRTVNNFKGGDRHAETEALATFDQMIAVKRLDPEQLAGATIEVVGDQVVCTKFCKPALQKWAELHKVKSVEGYVFTRPKYVGAGQAKPKQTATTYLQAPPAGQQGPSPLTPQQEYIC